MEEFLNLIDEMAAEDINKKSVQKNQKQNQKQEQEDIEAKTEEPGKKETNEQREKQKEYTSEELEQLLVSQPDKIDINRVSEQVRPLVSAQIKAMEQSKQKTEEETGLRQIQEYAAAIKTNAPNIAAQEVAQRFGTFDPYNPEHVTAYNQLVMQAERQADNLVKTYTLVSRLKREDGEIFDKALNLIEQEARRDPIIGKAWDEADISVLMPLYERYKAKLSKENVQKIAKKKQENKGKQPPQVIEPSVGQHGNNSSYSPSDLAGLDVDSQAEIIAQMGLLD